MIRYLIKERLRAPLFSKTGSKLWLRRAWSLLPLLRVWSSSRISKLRGADVAPHSLILPWCLGCRVSNLTVGDFSLVGRVQIQAHAEIRIGKCVVINDHVSLITGSHDIHSPTYAHIFSPIVIEDFAWVATGAVILKGVTIGRGAVVGAGSVVSKDVPPFAVVIGNPARLVSHRSDIHFTYKPTKFLSCVSAWVGNGGEIH